MANAHSSYLFTSESVTEGHPDKVCDQISDAVLDAILEKEIELAGQGYVSPSGQPADPTQVRCACETMATTGMIIVAGEIRTQAYVDVPALAREVLREIGYDRAKYGFDCDTCGVLNAIHDQSPDIAQGVDESYEAQHGQAGDDPYEKVGAGDQGMMFGYACDETSTLMPMPIYLAQRMAEQLAAVRKDGTMSYLRPDGKTQVSVRYIDDKPVNVEKVVVSTQHSEEISTEQLRAEIQRIREITDKPFGVNVMLLSPFADEVAQVVVEEKVPVVVTGAGLPSKYIKNWVENGLKVIPVVPSVAIARMCERMGACAVVAEGGESGGHVGDLTTMTLVPQVVDAVKIPVLAAGGIGDGRGVAAAFMLGAKGV